MIARLVLAAALLFSTVSFAPPQNFTYYLLSLSWAPDFCAQKNVPKDPAECGVGRKVAFVVHGLWPQDASGTGPENCGKAGTIPPDVIKATLPYIPTEKLIGHEWATHGTCSGLSAADYFAAARKARDAVTVPKELTAPTKSQKLRPADIESKFAAANPAFPKAAFRTSCTSGELQETRICFNKDLSPRACPAGLKECSSKTILVRPVR